MVYIKLDVKLKLLFLHLDLHFYIILSKNITLFITSFPVINFLYIIIIMKKYNLEVLWFYLLINCLIFFS